MYNDCIYCGYIQINVSKKISQWRIKIPKCKFLKTSKLVLQPFFYLHDFQKSVNAFFFTCQS